MISYMISYIIYDIIYDILYAKLSLTSHKLTVPHTYSQSSLTVTVSAKAES